MSPFAQGLFQHIGAQYKDFMLHFSFPHLQTFLPLLGSKLFIGISGRVDEVPALSIHIPFVNLSSVTSEPRVCPKKQSCFSLCLSALFLASPQWSKYKFHVSESDGRAAQELILNSLLLFCHLYLTH